MESIKSNGDSASGFLLNAIEPEVIEEHVLAIEKDIGRGLDHDGLILPEKVADTYFHIAQQHRSTWTHELDIRSFTDMPPNAAVSRFKTRRNCLTALDVETSDRRITGPSV